MKRLNYNWQRYWVSLTNAKISLTDQGFLEDPTSTVGKYVSTDLVTLDNINKLNCLILLGEPGIGKSVESKRMYKATHKEVGEDHVLWIDLNNIPTIDIFQQKLTNNPKYKQWVENNESLYLFLDSFDEGTYSFQKFARYFFDLLDEHSEKINNLRLRISCRTALWPPYLGDSLEALWGKENCQQYELCPLTKNDVRIALEAQGINTQRFLSEVLKKDVASIAGKPLTLSFLMETFTENDGQLPNRKLDIYSKGCEMLLREPDPSRRRDPSKKVTLNMPQKTAIAERIAVATLIGGKAAVVFDDTHNLSEGEIGITQLHGKELVDDIQTKLGDGELVEVLNTGLFSSRGAGKIGWAHQTYGEYLAARYIYRHRFPWSFTKSLLFQDPLKIGAFQVVPQLYEVSAWLASIDSSFFDNAVLLDPEFLLLSDTETITYQQKEVLVEQLLIRLDNGELFDNWKTYNDHNYRKLGHPRIAEQLQPYIEDNNKGIVVRRAAIDITRANEVGALEDLLINVALDDQDGLSIRVHAVLAIAQSGSDTSRLALKPLVGANFLNDPEDELRGAVLKALWPDSISSKEIFPLITPPKKRSFHGSYFGFVTRELSQSLQPEDILFALTWVEKNAIKPERLEYFTGTLSDAIMLKAIAEISNAKILNKVAAISYERLRNFAGIIGDRALSKETADRFQEALNSQDKGRKSLIKKIVQIINKKDKSEGRKAFILGQRNNIKLIYPKDLPWLVTWLEDEKNPNIQRIVVEIISMAFDVTDTNHIDMVYTARQRNPFLKEETKHWFEPALLDSDSAKYQRESWINTQSWQEKDEKEEILKVISIDRINELLEKSEGGDMDSWWRLNNAMCMYQHELDDPKFDQLPGWKVIDEDTKNRITECGRRFLSEQESKPEIWLGKGKIYFPAISGYRAIKAFYELEPEFIEKQGTAFWKRWAPITVGLPLVSNDPENGKIIALAYKYAADEVISTLDALIDDDAERHNSLFINDLLVDCLDVRMREFLIGKAQQEGFSSKASDEILCFLMSHSDKTAKSYIKSKIKIPTQKAKNEKEEILSAVASLLQNADKADWEFVWDLICKDNEFGRSVVFKFHDNPLRGSVVLNEIDEVQLADLYIWLTKEFPPEEYKRPEGGGTVTSDVSIGDWRDSVLRILMNKGTAEACRQIERVALVLPQYKWIKQYTLIEARRTATQKSWEPPEVKKLFKDIDDVANEKPNTYVNDDTLAELVDLISTKSTPKHKSIPKEFVKCFEEGKWGYIKYSDGTESQIGTTKTLPYRGLKILTFPNPGVGYTVEVFFTKLYGDKSGEKLKGYSNNKRSRMLQLLEYSFIKKLQKGNKLKNKMRVCIDTQKDIVFLEKL